MHIFNSVENVIFLNSLHSYYHCMRILVGLHSWTMFLVFVILPYFAILWYVVVSYYFWSWRGLFAFSNSVRHLFRCSLDICIVSWGFPGGSMVKNPPAYAGDADSIPGSGRCPGEGNGKPLQYSCLGHPMDRGAWWATVHGVAKRQRHDWAHLHRWSACKAPTCSFSFSLSLLICGSPWCVLDMIPLWTVCFTDTVSHSSLPFHSLLCHWTWGLNFNVVKVFSIFRYC